MPRLPAPTVILPTRQGRLIAAPAVAVALRGYRPTPVAPPIRRRQQPTAPPATAPGLPPAGLHTAAEAGLRLGIPADIVTRFATNHPDLLPPFELIDGQPYFTDAALEAAATTCGGQR